MSEETISTENKEKTIKYLENIRKRAEKLSKRRFEYCKVCGKKLAEWVGTNLKDLKDDKYEIYQIIDGDFVFACWDCDPKEDIIPDPLPKL